MYCIYLYICYVRSVAMCNWAMDYDLSSSSLVLCFMFYVCAVFCLRIRWLLNILPRQRFPCIKRSVWTLHATCDRYWVILSGTVKCPHVLHHWSPLHNMCTISKIYHTQHAAQAYHINNMVHIVYHILHNMVHIVYHVQKRYKKCIMLV